MLDLLELSFFLEDDDDDDDDDEFVVSGVFLLKVKRAAQVGQWWAKNATPLRSSRQQKFHRTQLFYEKTHTKTETKTEKSRLKQNTQVANNKLHTLNVLPPKLHVFIVSSRFF